MMYIHYCCKCDTIRMMSGHKPLCPACGHPLRELKTSFAQYTSLSQKDRNLLLTKIRETPLQ